MFVRSALISLTFLSILFPASAAALQAPEGSDAAAMHHESPVIRSTTRLVQVSVVVQDKRGNPVTGLKKEDFTVLDASPRSQGRTPR